MFPFALYILVTWQPPLEPNGIILNYQVGSAKYPGSEPKDTNVDLIDLSSNARRYLIGQRDELSNYVVEVGARTSPGWGESVRKATRTVRVSGELLKMWNHFSSGGWGGWGYSWTVLLGCVWHAS